MRRLYDDDGPDGPLPPRREQLPLPRRDEQTHLEPQLREPGGAGTGTPFVAFGADQPVGADPAPPTGERAATFREATRRAVDDQLPDDRLPDDQVPDDQRPDDQLPAGRPPDDQLPNGPASR